VLHTLLAQQLASWQQPGESYCWAGPAYILSLYPFPAGRSSALHHSTPEPAGVVEGRPAPPPSVAVDTKPGMIAKIRGPISMKNHSFAVRARSPIGATLGPSSSRTLLIPPSWSSPAFLLSALRPYAAEHVLCIRWPPALLSVHKKHDTRRYGLPFAGGPGPIRPAHGGLSRRRELRLYGVLRSS